MPELTKEAIEKRREYQREYYKNNKDKYKHREYYKNNKDKYKEAMRKYWEKKAKQQELEYEVPKRYVATGRGRSKKGKRETRIISEDGFVKYIKKLVPQGVNGYSSTLILPKEICEELRIESGENVKIYRDGNKIIIEKG